MFSRALCSPPDSSLAAGSRAACPLLRLLRAIPESDRRDFASAPVLPEYRFGPLIEPLPAILAPDPFVRRSIPSCALAAARHRLSAPQPDTFRLPILPCAVAPFDPVIHAPWPSLLPPA